MKRVTRVQAEPGYTLRVWFDDGLTGAIDLSSDLYGRMFEPLRDPRLFEQAHVDEFGTVCWPNGADLAPEVLYNDIVERVHRAS